MSYALRAEQAALDHLLQKHYRLLYHRVKIAQTEVDLVVVSPKYKIVCYEVKANSAHWAINQRVSQKQLLRLHNVKLFLEAHLMCCVEFKIITIGPKIEEFFLTDCL